ncbi:MAG: hypothetical protein EOM87_06455, partial [Clostridia bacterium]|nr:hypothetical protein [Clostridia bacterium]
MRKATRLIVFLLILTFIFTATTACNDKGYSISFVSFGEEVAIIKLKGKGEIHLPNLSKDGFIFLGWFLDENIWNNPFTDTYFSEKKIDRNYVVYARWKEVEQVEALGGALVTERINPIRVMETLKPVGITQPRPGVYVYDMGQNMV